MIEAVRPQLGLASPASLGEAASLVGTAVTSCHQYLRTALGDDGPRR